MPRSGHRNKVVGQAGEFAVCAQLGKLGLVATPFAGNVPIYDLIVVDENLKSIPVQVKTIFKGGTWMCGAATTYLDLTFDAQSGKQHVHGRREAEHPDLLMVYVILAGDPTQADQFFICTRAEAWAAIGQSYIDWMSDAKRDWKRPKKPESLDCRVSLEYMEPHRNRWDKIVSRLRPAHLEADPAELDEDEDYGSAG